MHESWRGPLATQFESPYMQALRDFLTTQKAQGKRIFPKGSEYFRAFDLTPLEEVRVVILGQDPYHAVGQAHGLCFSVQPAVTAALTVATPAATQQARHWTLEDQLSITEVGGLSISADGHSAFYLVREIGRASCRERVGQYV